MTAPLRSFACLSLLLLALPVAQAQSRGAEDPEAAGLGQRLCLGQVLLRLALAVLSPLRWWCLILEIY